MEAPGDLYRRNRGDTGLVLVPKLKYEHVHLTSFSKMWVDLATEVSTLLYMFTFICDQFELLHATGPRDSVSKALLLTGGEEARQTAKFCDMFNKFFDCLNVSNFTAGQRSRHAFKSPYRKGKEDFRLKV